MGLSSSKRSLSAYTRLNILSAVTKTPSTPVALPSFRPARGRMLATNVVRHWTPPLPYTTSSYLPSMPNNGIPLVVGAIAGVALTPVVAPLALGLVGFSAAGPVAGTFAAIIQSGIGNVVAGSAFATAQSVAMGGAIPTVVTAIGAGVGSLIGATVAGGDGGDGSDGGGGDASEGDGDSGDGGNGTPPKSRFLVVVHPYPLNANLELRADRRALALWLVCCIGKDALRAMYYRPSSLEKVVIEVDRECDRFNELLGQHVWSEFLVEPTKEEMGKSSMVFFSTFNPSRHITDGWKRVKMEEHWFKGFDNNSIIKYPYPLSEKSFPMPLSPPAPPGNCNMLYLAYVALMSNRR